MSVFVDPDYRAVMNRLAAFRAPDDVNEAVAMMRTMRGEAPSLDDLYPEPEWIRAEHHIPRAAGSLRVVTARPRITTALPVLFAVHGGGLISGTAEHGMREIAHLLDEDEPTAVVSVEYGLAPETGFDGAVQDCADALNWLRHEGAAHGLDLTRVVVVAQSAGGAIATRALVQTGVGVRGVLLSAPMLDDRSDSWSMQSLAGMGTWDLGWNRASWAAARRDGSHTVAPAQLEDVTYLHRVFLDVGSADPMLGEVTAFAARLWQAGSDAELHVWSGAFHGFDLVVPDAAVSRQARAARRQWLGRTFGRLPR